MTRGELITQYNTTCHFLISILTPDSSRAPGLASGLQGSMNVHRGALLLVPQ